MSRPPDTAPTSLPFATHAELMEGLRAKRFQLSVRFDPRSLGWFDTVRERVVFGLMACSPAIVAAVFVARAFQTRQFWLLLAVPLSYFDYRTSSAVLSLSNLLYWVVWCLIGVVCLLVSRSLAHALFVVPPWFFLTQLVGCTGKGITHARVVEAIANDETAFDWFEQRGTVALLDHRTGRWHGNPHARPFGPEGEDHEPRDGA